MTTLNTLANRGLDRLIEVKRKKRTLSESALLAFNIIASVALVWIVVSYINVAVNNLSFGESAKHFEWNFFKVFFEGAVNWEMANTVIISLLVVSGLVMRDTKTKAFVLIMLFSLSTVVCYLGDLKLALLMLVCTVINIAVMLMRLKRKTK